MHSIAIIPSLEPRLTLVELGLSWIVQGLLRSARYSWQLVSNRYVGYHTPTEQLMMQGKTVPCYIAKNNYLYYTNNLSTCSL